MKKTKVIFILALLVLVGTFGYQLGKFRVELAWKNYKPTFSVKNPQPPKDKEVDFQLFWDVWERLSKNYIDKEKLDIQKMVYGAISGMTAALGDPYTVFLPPQENKSFKEEMAGLKFEGIGAQLGAKNEKIVIIAPLRGMPAEKAGIKAGDVILKVDGEQTSGWTVPEAVAKIRGPAGTKVILTVLHEKDKEPVEIEIIRETIIVKSAEWETKAEARCAGEAESDAQCQKVIYLKLSRFGDGTGDWEKAVREINQEIRKSGNQKIRGLVLDLRNNPGGYLSGAVFVTSEFLKSGVVVKQEGIGGIQTFSVDRQGQLTEIPLIVLINKGSASASEIVAGAIKERGRGKIVGEKSFGKGTIQEAQDVGEGAGLHITTAKWLLPSGIWINGEGITPDYEVKMDEKDETRDLQLEKAIEILTK